MFNYSKENIILSLVVQFPFNDSNDRGGMNKQKIYSIKINLKNCDKYYKFGISHC